MNTHLVPASALSVRRSQPIGIALLFNSPLISTPMITVPNPRQFSQKATPFATFGENCLIPVPRSTGDRGAHHLNGELRIRLHNLRELGAAGELQATWVGTVLTRVLTWVSR
jgi:hypothetical protein